MVDLYRGLVYDANVKMKRQSFYTGLLMGYSQFSIYAVYGLIIWFGGACKEVCVWGGAFDACVSACPCVCTSTPTYNAYSCRTGL